MGMTRYFETVITEIPKNGHFTIKYERLETFAAQAGTQAPTTITNTIHLLTDSASPSETLAPAASAVPSDIRFSLNAPVSQTAAPSATSSSNLPMFLAPSRPPRRTLATSPSISNAKPSATASVLSSTGNPSAVPPPPPPPAATTRNAHNERSILLGSIIGGVLGLGLLAMLAYCIFGCLRKARAHKKWAQETEAKIDATPFQSQNIGSFSPTSFYPASPESSRHAQVNSGSHDAQNPPPHRDLQLDTVVPPMLAPVQFEASPFNSEDLLQISRFVRPPIPPRSQKRRSRLITHTGPPAPAKPPSRPFQFLPFATSRGSHIDSPGPPRVLVSKPERIARAVSLAPAAPFPRRAPPTGGCDPEVYADSQPTQSEFFFEDSPTGQLSTMELSTTKPCIGNSDSPGLSTQSKRTRLSPILKPTVNIYQQGRVVSPRSAGDDPYDGFINFVKNYS